MHVVKAFCNMADMLIQNMIGNVRQELFVQNVFAVAD